MSGLILRRNALSDAPCRSTITGDTLLPMTNPIRSRADARRSIPARGLSFFALLALLPLIAACETTGTSTPGTGGSGMIAGDEKGGKVVGGVKEGGTQQAMAAVTAHCAQYNKKAFITQMEAPAQGGLMAFVCLDNDGRASPKPR
jgi:hypothetical protein